MTTVFSKIIAGEIPAHKVYEDAVVLAFLDIHPVRAGHVLVIPKVTVDHFCDLDDATATHLLQVANRIARVMRQNLGCARVAYVVMGDEVPHAHVHLIPYDGGEVGLSRAAGAASAPDHTALALMAGRLASALAAAS